MENTTIALHKKKTTIVMPQNSNISEMWETGSKTRHNEQCQCGDRSGVIDTQIFSRLPSTHPPMGKKNVTC